MGWDADHFSDYSLQELIYSHFAIYRGSARGLRQRFSTPKSTRPRSRTKV